MIASRDRILTTHVGSLPRNEALSELLVRREAGESFDQGQFEAEVGAVQPPPDRRAFQFNQIGTTP